MIILNSLSGESSIPIAISSVSEATFLKRITPVSPGIDFGEENDF